MMKRDVYAYITTLALTIAFGFSVFLIVSDNILPFTTQATVKTMSIDVVPEVSGYIQTIYVKEGQQVHPGERLFDIDPTQYQIARDKAQASFLQAKNQWTQAERHLKRVKALSQQALTSQETLDDALTNEESSRATFWSAQADVNLAQLNLDRTQVKAQEPGVVTNLSYAQGMYASTATAVIHLVQNARWLEADFTEKGLGVLKLNQEVDIVYDAIPNRVFLGKIVAIDRAISSGVNNKNQLVEISDESRWIRPQQKIRVRVAPETRNLLIVGGSRASVMVRGSGGIADTWMTMLSWFRFVY